ncbi:hypothetical protein [Streptomyces hebeiensis]
MYKTTSTVWALVGVTVTAVSGCMAVAPGPTPEPGPRPGLTGAAPRAGDARGTRIVQSPAREALERIAPVAGTPRPAPRVAPEPRRPAHGRTSGPGYGSGHLAGRPAVPLPRPGKPSERPAQRLSPVPPAAAALATDVCAIGETYGRWGEESLSDRVCRDVYGR